MSSDGDTYDVSLTSEYTLTDTSQRRLIVECAVIAKEFDLYEMSTVVDLIFQNGNLKQNSKLFHDMQLSSNHMIL